MTGRLLHHWLTVICPHMSVSGTGVLAAMVIPLQAAYLPAWIAYAIVNGTIATGMVGTRSCPSTLPAAAGEAAHAPHVQSVAAAHISPLRGAPRPGTVASRPSHPHTLLIRGGESPFFFTRSPVAASDAQALTRTALCYAVGCGSRMRPQRLLQQPHPAGRYRVHVPLFPACPVLLVAALSRGAHSARAQLCARHRRTAALRHRPPLRTVPCKMCG